MSSSILRLFVNTKKSVQGDVYLEDILTTEEISLALKDLQSIRNNFKKITKLNNADIVFLGIATALQTLRWIFGTAYIISETIAVIINLIIQIVHRLFFDEQKLRQAFASFRHRIAS